MAVVSLLNQAPYRRAHSSRERLNIADREDESWLHGDSRHNNNHALESKRTRGCRGALSGSHQCSLETCDRIAINVSGMHYEAWQTVFERHPTTLLGDPNKRQRYYDRRKREYFFDRHRPTFEAIFNYYQYGGGLRRPETVPDDIFQSELDFFEIESEEVDAYRADEGYVEETILLPEGPKQKKIWMIMEYPETSKPAYVVAIISVLVTLISIVLFCVETIPSVQQTECTPGSRPNFLEPFFIIETLCTFWFTVEVVVRVIVCPSKPKFFKDFKNLVDITAIIPYYVTLSNILINMDCDSANSSTSLAFLRVIRLVRVFKLTKHSAGLQVLIMTFRASLQGLLLFLVAMIVCILLFSSAIYYAELGIDDSQINSIPDGFWWAVITMTTVGYGDKVPVGVWGKLIGSLCALAGVLTLSIPVPIITENFNKFYAHKTGRGRI